MRSLLAPIARLPSTVINALRGLRTATKRQQSFQLQLIAVAIAIPLAPYLGETGVERAELIVPIFIVLIVEPLNTAIETTIDRIGPEPHPLSRRAKAPQAPRTAQPPHLPPYPPSLHTPPRSARYAAAASGAPSPRSCALTPLPARHARRHPAPKPRWPSRRVR